MASRQTDKQRLRAERLEREREAKRLIQRRRRMSIAAAVVAAIVAGVTVVMASRGGDDSSAPAGEAPPSIADVHGIGVNPSDNARAGSDGLRGGWT